MPEEKLRYEVAACCRMLERLGLIDQDGHVSARIPGTDQILIATEQNPITPASRNPHFLPQITQIYTDSPKSSLNAKSAKKTRRTQSVFKIFGNLASKNFLSFFLKKCLSRKSEGGPNTKPHWKYYIFEGRGGPVSSIFHHRVSFLIRHPASVSNPVNNSLIFNTYGSTPNSFFSLFLCQSKKPGCRTKKSK